MFTKLNPGIVLLEIEKDITTAEAAAIFCSENFKYPLKVDKIDRRGVFTVDGLADRIVYWAFRTKSQRGITLHQIRRVYGYRFEPTSGQFVTN